MVVFFGKTGSNAINLLDHGLPVRAGFTNEADSLAKKEFLQREIPVENTDNLRADLAKYDPKLIVLAGFMRIVPAWMTQQYTIINIHPSLLPHYKGLHAQKRSFEDRRHCGITIHYVNEDLDAGEIIKQVPLDPDCDFDTYMARLKQAEHTWLPRVAKQLLQGAG